ncbi:MAG: class B sortase [Ruminiclostridium sp.]
MTTYMEKYPRRNGVATKKPGFWKRLFKGIIPWKGDSAGVVIRKLIFIVALIVFLITAVPLVSDIFLMFRDQWRSQGISDIYIPDGNNGGSSKEILPSFKKLLEINPDTVGYLKIDGTAIDYPVVKGTDNDYYLTHDFYREKSKSGSVMMDCNCVVSPDGHSGNMVLYGHNMAVGTFFACLSEYWRTLYDSYDEPSMQFYKDHPTITFNTLYEEAEWKIFGIGLFNIYEEYGEVYSNYNNKHDFTSRDDFNHFIIDLMDRSDIFTDVDIEYGDDILTLSTCYWPFRSDMDNVRLAIFARKVRPGESTYVDVSKAKVNTYVKRWQWVYDNIGGGYDWSQSNWDRRKLLSYTAEDAEKDGYTFIDDINDEDGIYDYNNGDDGYNY